MTKAINEVVGSDDPPCVEIELDSKVCYLKFPPRAQASPS